jgi:hypothetical protein
MCVGVDIIRLVLLCVSVQILYILCCYVCRCRYYTSCVVMCVGVDIIHLVLLCVSVQILYILCCYVCRCRYYISCVVMCVGVDIIHFEPFSMEWQQFHTPSIFDLLVIACTKKCYLYLHVKRPIILTDFTLIWSVLADFPKSLHYQIFE